MVEKEESLGVTDGGKRGLVFSFSFFFNLFIYLLGGVAN